MSIQPRLPVVVIREERVGKRRDLMASYAIDLPYLVRSVGLYEQAPEDFLIGKPTPTRASIMFHEVGGRRRHLGLGQATEIGGWQMKRLGRLASLF